MSGPPEAELTRESVWPVWWKISYVVNAHQTALTLGSL